MSKLLYIRHGQASFGKPDYDQLSEKGYQQGRDLGIHFLETDYNMDVIYVGPLKRHWQTYDMVKEAYEKAGRALPEPILFESLNEHRGPEVLKQNLPNLVKTDAVIAKWENERRKNKNLWSKNGMLIFDRAMNLWANGHFDEDHPEEYAKWPEFREIVGNGFDELMQKHSKERGINIALFTSGGTISAILGKVLQMPNHSSVIKLNGIVQNTSMTEILFNDAKATLKSFNLVPHLSNDMITYV
ncbi:MAG: broad specificity phosphatase PhoE [Saprospiraceae bacterium]|jgi:broad specificity phosphatase PhoE